MKVDSKNLKRARELLSELQNLENALNVTNNYDWELSAQFYTFHNENTKTPLKINVPLSKKGDLKDQILEHINQRILEIKKELETL